MLIRIAQRSLFLVALFLVTLCSLAAAQTPLRIPDKPNPNLYRENVNAQKEIDDAVAGASKSKKRILLVFGGNWCGDCYALDYAFHQPKIEPFLSSHYMVVHVNVGRFDKNLDLARKYRVDLEKGVPSIAVLDPMGHVVADSSEFENARAMTEEDVLKFLDRWKPADGH